MKDEITFSTKFIDKFIGSTMDNISDRGFFRSIYSYVIDSKERTRVKVNNFLNDQLINPDQKLIDLSKFFKQMYPDSDERIIRILKHVHTHILYKYDKDNWNKVEFWATASETLNRGFDDCDGINNLIWVIARLSGISGLQLWCNIGDTKVSGHFWLTYFSTKHGVWYSIDGTYYPEFRYIWKGRPLFKFHKNKYLSIWCMFNDEYSYKSR